MVLVSGHDDNLSAFFANFYEDNHLCILKAFDHRFNKKQSFDEKTCFMKMKYSSNFVLEVYDEKGQIYVQILFNGKILIPKLRWSQFKAVLRRNQRGFP